MEAPAALDSDLPKPLGRAVVPVIVGDGVGPDIWAAAEPVLTAAAEGIGKALEFLPVPAGSEAFASYGQHLPDETLAAIRERGIALKGPLATPVGGGIRSLHVAIRQRLDLYACVRPIKWIPGVPSPVKFPERADMVIFRENTEDVYQGLEWAAGTAEAEELIKFARERLGANVRPGSAVGLKPMSEFGAKRLVKMAARWAIKEGRPSLTLVHKGNIMKFTEGAFRSWGYEAAKEALGGRFVSEKELGGDPPAGRVVVGDRIADNMFMQSLLRPEEYSILAMPNLNGDYLSDCLAGQIGGLGMAPGANLGDDLAVFAATHGTAPTYAGLDMVNPSSLILSGCMMLEHLGWGEASDRIKAALERAMADGVYTCDLARQIPGAKAVKCSQFGRALLERL